MNSTKSSLYFGCHSDYKVVTKWLSVTPSELPSSYLGLPLFSGRLTKEMCFPLVSKFERKLDTWKANTLSMARRLELLLSTPSNFSLFWSMTFPLLAFVIGKIDKHCRSFLWGDLENKRKVHPVPWKIICFPRSEGSMGVKDTKCMSRAGDILNLWNIASEKSSLWVRWVHGRYLSQGKSIWSYDCKSSDSWAWKKLLSNRHLIQNMVQFHIGNGLKVFSLERSMGLWILPY